LPRVPGCTHLVPEVAENNESALRFYRGRHFFELDATFFLAKNDRQGRRALTPAKNSPPPRCWGASG
jgi:hypothetical protein